MMAVKKFTLISLSAMPITNRSANFNNISLESFTRGQCIFKFLWKTKKMKSLFKNKDRNNHAIRRMLFTTARAAACQANMWAKLHVICKSASVNTKTPPNSQNLPDISIKTPITRSLGKSSLPPIPASI